MRSATEGMVVLMTTRQELQESGMHDILLQEFVKQNVELFRHLEEEDLKQVTNQMQVRVMSGIFNGWPNLYPTLITS